MPGERSSFQEIVPVTGWMAETSCHLPFPTQVPLFTSNAEKDM